MDFSKIPNVDKQAAEKLDNFFCQYKKVSFKKGETILRAGEEPRGVYYLNKGYARLYSISKNAQELTFIIYKPRDFFPLIWTIANQQPLYYTEAVTAVELCQAPKEEFLAFIKNNSDVLLEITNRILTRFAGLLKRMEYSIFGNAANKVESIIVICAERFGIPHQEGILIQIPLTHQDLANLLGVARETVSLEMEKLQKNNIIGRQRKHLIVKNLQKLKEQSILNLLS